MTGPRRPPSEGAGGRILRILASKGRADTRRGRTVAGREGPQSGGPSRARRRRPGKVLSLPLSTTRVGVASDGTVTLLGGPSVRLGPAGFGPPRDARSEGLPPGVEWRRTRGRMSFRFGVFAGESCALERVEIGNPFREAREIELAAEVGLPPEAGRVRMDGTVVRGEGGGVLVAFSGAGIARARLPGPGGGTARLDLRAVLPPGGKGLVDVVLAPPGAGRRPRGFTREQNEALARWQAVLERLGRATLPDASLQSAFGRAITAAAGSLTPGGGGPWPRPGFPPQAGPATLDAVALRALDVWGGARLVDECLAAAFDAQGKAAPPGGRFRRAAGYLGAPLDGEPRDRWASDCGALLELAARRRDVAVPARWLRESCPHVLAACEWIVGELGADGLMPPARGPLGPGPAGRTWTDAWSWRGLDAAGEALAAAGDPEAERLLRAAAEYRERIARAWGPDPRTRAWLAALRVTGRGPAPPEGLARRHGLLAAAAASLGSGGLDAEAELREAAAFLIALRKTLVADGRGVLALLPGAARGWFAPGSALGFERLPTRHGPVSVSVTCARKARRIVAEVDLPRLARGEVRVELHLAPPGGSTVRRVRVDGSRARARPRAGTVELPARRRLRIVAELSR